MPVGATIAAAAVTAGASIYSANKSNSAVKDATAASTESNAAALALNKEQADRTDAEFAPWRTVGAGALQMLARTEGIQIPADTFSYYHLPTANDGTPIPGGTTAGAGPTSGTPGTLPPLITPGVSAGQAYLNANPDVMAEYNRILPTVDWNSPWAAQHGFVQGNPGAFGDWHYQTYGKTEGRTPGTAVAPVYGPATPATGGTPAPAPSPAPQVATGAKDINGNPIMSTAGKPTGLIAPGNGPPGSDPRYGDFFASPDYQFRKDEGTRAITGNAAAKGLIDSGSLGKGLINYGQRAASDEFGQWYNRIAALAGVGQTAVGQSAAAGAASAAAQTGIIQAQGDNLKSSIVAQGGINAGLITGVGSAVSGVIRNLPTNSPPNTMVTNPLPQGFDIAATNPGRTGGLFGPPI